MIDTDEKLSASNFLDAWEEGPHSARSGLKMPLSGLLRAGGSLNRVLVPFGTLKQAVTSRAMTVDASVNSSAELDAPDPEIAGRVQKNYASLQIDDGVYHLQCTEIREPRGTDQCVKRG